MNHLGEIGECWIPDDLVRTADPITPYPLWPIAFIAGLFIAWAIDQAMRPKQ